VSIVSNTPPLGKFDTLSAAAQPHRGEALRLLYAGLVTKGRGVDTVIDGLARFVGRHRTPVRLTVVGDGDGLAGCREQVWELGLVGIVEMLGWQDNERMVEYAQHANVGLVPHHVSGHSNHTVPNKLFDYMAAGLPVLSSNMRPVSRILNETGAGLVYEDWNGESFAEALAQLVDPMRRQAMAERGQQAVREHYHWERDSARLLEDIARTAARYTTRGHGVNARSVGSGTRVGR
jgi:glycosyltransferase involved in cell wall biosynthesis